MLNTREWGNCCAVVSPGYDMATAAMTSCQLWLSACDQPKIKPVSILPWLGEGYEKFIQKMKLAGFDAEGFGKSWESVKER